MNSHTQISSGIHTQEHTLIAFYLCGRLAGRIHNLNVFSFVFIQSVKMGIKITQANLFFILKKRNIKKRDY